LFLKEGFEGKIKDFEGNFNFAKRLSEHFERTTKILVWNEDDVTKLENQVIKQ